MSYLGNTPETYNFVAGADRFSGNASTTRFLLTRRIGTANDVIAIVENVIQDPFTAYTVSANTTSGLSDIVFDSAPPSGTNNIVVNYRSSQLVAFNIVTEQQLQANSVTTSKIADGSITSAKIADGTVIAADIADGSVTGPKLGLTAINANNIVDASITGAKLAAATVTGDKLGLTAINANNIVDGTITGVKIATGTITGDDLAGNIIRANNIVAGQITGNLIGSTAVGANNIVANTDTVTVLSVSPGVYGNSSFIPTITVSANGRISSISNSAVSGIDAHPFVFTAIGS